MPNLTIDQKKELAKKYWAIKGVGTVEALCRDAGVSKPTLLAIANEFPPEKKELAPAAKVKT